MNSRWSLLILLGFSLAAIVFQLAGGFSAGLHMATTMAPGSAPAMPHTMTLLAGIASALAWIWGIVITVRNKQWKWCITIGLTTYVGAIVYIIYVFIHDIKQNNVNEVSAPINN